MGYFSQKKKQHRKNLLLNIILILLSMVSLTIFFDDGTNGFINYINLWRYQIYLFACLILIYSVFQKRFIYAFLAFVIVFINYMFLASSANLFKNIRLKDADNFSVIYQNKALKANKLISQGLKNNADVVAINSYKAITLPQSSNYNNYGTQQKSARSFIASYLEVIKSGRINFNKKLSASFITFSHQNQDVTLVNLNFENMQPNEQKAVFDNLTEFVLDQDGPVIVIGEFGIPAWSNVFKHFLNITGLEVKNKVILSEGYYTLNVFAVPSFNVLGFKNVGVGNITFLDKKGSRKHPLLIDLEIN